MSADKTSKGYRRDTDRPFKTYNLELPTAFQFSHARQNPQSMLLPTVPLTVQQYQQNRHLLQQEQQQQHQQSRHLPQQQQHQQSRHLPQQQQHQQSRHLPQHEQQQQQNQQPVSGPLNDTPLHLSGDHVNFRQNAPPRQHSVQNITVDLDSANFVYDQLNLDDSGSALLRPDLLATSESLIQQSEQDLNIFNASCSAASSQIQNVFPTSANAAKPPFDALISAQESQALYDNLLAAPTSSLPRIRVPTSVMSSLGNNFFQNPTSSRNNVTSTSPLSVMPVSSSLPANAMNSVTQAGQFPVKLEVEDKHVLAMGNINTPAASLSQNVLNQNIFLGKFGNITMNTFSQNSSSTASFPSFNANMGNKNTPATSLSQNVPNQNIFLDKFRNIAMNAFPQNSSPTASFPSFNANMGNKNTPAASLSQNVPNQNIFLDKFRNIAINTFSQNSSSTTSFPSCNANMGNTHGVSSGLTSPVRVFQGSFMSSNRSPSESSTSSVNLSLDDSTTTSPKRPSSIAGDTKTVADFKDRSYVEKRRKNNESAKRSRDARRSKEEKIVLEVVTLEQQNLKMKTEIEFLETENACLKIRLSEFPSTRNLAL